MLRATRQDVNRSRLHVVHARPPTRFAVVLHTVRTASPQDAAAFIRRGQIVAFPTETVYGLGADAFNPDAVRAIFAAKGRPQDNPLIVHVADSEQIEEVAQAIPPAARTLLEVFIPGPLTLILPKHRNVPDVVTAGLDTVGVRMPKHPVARAFLEACGTPVAAPSANRSGRPSPTTWKAVADDLDGRISCILTGDRTKAGVESTVVDCTQSPPAVLRPGAVPVEALQAALPGVGVVPPSDETAARSPGTRHRHYAPAARVCLVDHPDDVPSATDVAHDAAYIGLEAPVASDRLARVHVAANAEAYAHALFHFFRESDAAGCETIYAQTVPDAGWGRALNDRLRRAAAR